MPSFRSAPAFRLACSGAALLVALFAWSGCRPRAGDSAGAPASAPRYVGRAACAACHAAETARWTGSDHDRAMAPATGETVLGDFDDARFVHQGVETRFFRDGGRFLVRTEGPTGAPDTFEVKFTFGHRPLQQYLVEFPDGRLQTLTVAWDVRARRWFSLYPGERIPPDDWLHWTKPGMNWNYMCADCHSTNLRRGFDAAANRYNTTYAEIDVSCEACHGPGEEHVRLARAGGARGPDGRYGLTVRLGEPEPARTQVETCAPCHSRRQIVADGWRPGERLLDFYEPALLEEELYFPDGQIRDEVYEYGSFVQSRMYREGVRCSDCHDPHSAGLRAEGNALCTRCHEPARFDRPEHHHHPEGSAGAACVSCHMPVRTYMIVDPRRDHGMKVPRPDLSAELGTPNACTECHRDRPAAWAAGRVAAWFGPARAGDASFARTLAAGRKGDPGAEIALSRLAGERLRPAVVRATAVRLLGQYGTPGAVATAREALRDPDALVRAAAIRALERLAPERTGPVEPLLRDTVRLVRTEAARVLAREAGRFGGREDEPARAFRAALDEYRARQAALGDQPAAHLNLAVTHEALGEPDLAEEAYRTALRLDSSFTPALLNLAMLYDRRRLAALEAGRADEAGRLFRETEETLRRALRRRPEDAGALYTLGLLLAEDEGRLPEAAGLLERAAARDPENARVQYNAGLAHQQLGEAAAAERRLLAALRLEPASVDFLNALSVLHAQQERWPEALRYTRRLAEQLPGNPEVMQRLAYLEERAASRGR